MSTTAVESHPLRLTSRDVLREQPTLDAWFNSFSDYDLHVRVRRSRGTKAHKSHWQAAMLCLSERECSRQSIRKCVHLVAYCSFGTCSKDTVQARMIIRINVRPTSLLPDSPVPILQNNSAQRSPKELYLFMADVCRFSVQGT